MFNDEYAWTHEDIQEILDTQLVETSAESKGYAFSMCSKETVIKIMIWNMKKEPYEDAENEYHRFDSNIMYNKNLHEYLKDSKFRERFRGILRLYWFDEDDYETMLDSVKCYKIDANQIQ